MNPERWQQIDRLLSEALKRELGERRIFLQHACTGDDELLQEVSLLIEAHDRAGSLFPQQNGIVSRRIRLTARG